MFRYMMFHHVYYWRAVDMNNVPMLKAVASSLHDYIDVSIVLFCGFTTMFAAHPSPHSLCLDAT